MTPYLRAVAHGGKATIDAWNAHLIEFHRVFPDATSLPLALMHAPQDRSPYDFAAERIHTAKPQARNVLDIGCGDGRLLRALGERYGTSLVLHGIDLSDMEIQRARAIVPQAHLETVDAHNASFERDTFDLVTGHLSFALFPRVRAMFARVHTWLSPGGVLAMVLEDPLAESAIFRAVAAAMQPVRRRFPAFAPLVPERDRCEDDAVLAVLLRDAGFPTAPHIERFALSERLVPEQLWEILRRTYAFGLLPIDLQGEAEHAMRDSLGDLGSDGRVDAALPLRFITASR